MRLDFEKYRHHVDGFDLSEEQKEELLLTVWRLVENVVDRSFKGPNHESIGCDGAEFGGQEALAPLDYEEIPQRSDPKTGRFEL